MAGGKIIDCHLHVIEPARFPITPGIGYTPRPDEDGTREALAATLDASGIHGAVIVQPSCRGFDNSSLLDAVAASPGRYKGIAVIRGDEPDRDLDRLAQSGVVGLRFNLASFDGEALRGPEAPRLLARIKHLDWFAQVHARDAQWAATAPLLRDSGVKVIVDHFGLESASDPEAPGFRAVIGLGDAGRAVLKLSAPFRIVPRPETDTALARRVETLLASFDGERRVWGSDWPFLALDTRPSYAHALGLLRRWVPDEAERDKVLWNNPARLFGFGVPA